MCPSRNMQSFLTKKARKLGFINIGSHPTLILLVLLNLSGSVGFFLIFVFHELTKQCF